MGATFGGADVHGPAAQETTEKDNSWVEKFVRAGGAAAEAARHEHHRYPTH